ncbi:hypothetical protein PS865_04881 [Pseudomonas fluorescens]|uniref:gp53-like domain-containing protein n=1 Tax=Pseudomonas fluorescens TaxID=294 RepID=UPI00125B2A94|nr:hypothetical protein [Pseudomonas fluorescens]VVP41482.1 hypothetical protein PS865_04881 [Pseudomonas fluorescens]
MDFPKSVPSVGLVDGKFVDEDPVAGTPGSLIPAQWGNAVTEEILNVVLDAGLTPDEASNDQLKTAIGLIIGASNVATTATQAEAVAGTNNTKRMTPLRVFQAIAAVVVQATEAAFGWAKVATQAQTNIGTDDTTIVTPKKLNSYINTVIVQATESLLGVLKVATQAQTNAGADDTTAVTPKKLISYINTVIVQANESLLGVLKIATQAQTNAGADDTTAVTPKKLRFGFSISLGQNGYIAFPSWLGGLTIQWARATLAVPGGYAWTYPTPFPNAVFNCWASVYAPTAADVINRTSQPIAPGLTACAFAISANGAAISASTSISLLAIGY